MKQRMAIFTLVHNEAYFLPLWTRHYVQNFPGAAIFVLDHNSSDGSTDDLPVTVTVHRLHHPFFQDHQWMNETVNAFQVDLLRDYEVVIFAEVDEFLVGPTPDLSGYVDAALQTAKSLRCTGVEVVEDTESRTHRMVFDSRYDKTLVSTVPCAWGLGFHVAGLDDDQVAPDPAFLLVHMHRADRDAYLKRKLGFIKKRQEYATENEAFGYQNKFVTLQDILDYYYRDRETWQDLLPAVKALVESSFKTFRSPVCKEDG